MTPINKKNKKKRKKKGKGIVRTGDRILWTPTWAGGHSGKRWSTRLREIEHHLKEKNIPLASKITVRRPAQ